MPIDTASQDLLRLRLDHLIDARQGLAVIGSHMPWQEIQASLSHLSSRTVKAGKTLPGVDLFGEQAQLSPVRCNAGRPRVPLRTRRMPSCSKSPATSWCKQPRVLG
jgi:transposase, IS5 family